MQVWERGSQLPLADVLEFQEMLAKDELHFMLNCEMAHLRV